MTVKEDNQLWVKIENFPLDEPDAAFNFSQKLAKEQTWSAPFTKRVIEEYRKFIYLCCITEKGASPSPAVDQAWHLHLTYTKSYWIDFCKNTLGKEVHHHPSKGGTNENHKHESWYRETLQIYQNVFGVKPPADIWPQPVAHTRILDEIPNNNKWQWAVAIMALPFLFSMLVYGSYNPYRLTGPEFLFFYAFLALAVVIAFLVSDNSSSAGAIVSNYFPENASVFQVANFLYGKHRAIQTAIVDLIRRDLLKVNADKTLVVCNNRYVARHPEENPLIAPLLQQADNSATNYEEIAANWYRDNQFSHPVLDKLYEFAHRKRRIAHDTIFHVVLLVVGSLRVIQGLGNGRPVVLLIIEMVVFTILLKLVMKSQSILKKAAGFFEDRLRQNMGYADEVVNKFVTKGPQVITGFAEGALLFSVFILYDPFETARRNGDTFWGGCGSSTSGSSCSGSSCSSGSSCGSGGCGGCSGGGD